MTRHFKKFALTHKFLFKGKPVPFAPIGNNEGVGQFDDVIDAEVVAELDKAADARRGGIVRISAEAAEGSKKNSSPLTPLPRPPGVLQPIRAINLESLVPKSNEPPKSAAESAGAVLPPPRNRGPMPILGAAPVVAVPPLVPPAATATAAKPSITPATTPTVPPPAAKQPFKPARAKRSEVEKKVADAKPQGE